MRFDTTIGTLTVITDWAPLLHFLEARRTRFPAQEQREVVLRVEVVDRSEIDASPSDPADAYPRSVYVEGCRFVLWRDRIEGKVPRDSDRSGIVVAWLWYSLPIVCAPDGWECLHSAAVDTGTGAVLIAGEAGSGKSSAALDLISGGAWHFSDDRVLVNAAGTVARSWDRLVHVDPRTAASMGRDALTLDGFGKVWIEPVSPARRAEAPIVAVYKTTEVAFARDQGPGWDCTWLNDYGAAARLGARAQFVPDRRLDGLRVAITNRNTKAADTYWHGGDIAHASGYAAGLRALGARVEIVPYDELEESRYDLIHLLHAQFPWSRRVAESTSKPLVVTAITQHSPPVEEVAPAANRAAVVLCYSPLEEEWYVERFPRLPRDRFVTIPHGVPRDIYRPSTASSTRCVFMAGRYAPTKNQMTVLRACMDLRVPVTFAGMVDAGLGGYLQQLREVAGRWTGVRFMGRLQGEVLWRRYQEAHVHVQPSTWEPFGLCTWEALACGCNIVATSQGFGRPWFEPHGTICDPDLESVREAIERELSLPRDRHRFRPPTDEQAARHLVPIYRRALS